jgi:hypothetical protein
MPAAGPGGVEVTVAFDPIDVAEEILEDALHHMNRGSDSSRAKGIVMRYGQRSGGRLNVLGCNVKR